MPAGNYFVSWAFEVANDAGEIVKVTVDSGGNLSTGNYAGLGGGSQLAVSGFAVVSHGGGNLDVSISFLSVGGTGNALIRNIRVASWKIP